MSETYSKNPGQRCEICGNIIEDKPYQPSGIWTVCSEDCAKRADEIEKKQMEELMREKR